ncbi:MAG: hypothetical protein QXM96_02720 [Candidatus Woesearchaeota archaeon]
MEFIKEIITEIRYNFFMKLTQLIFYIIMFYLNKEAFKTGMFLILILYFLKSLIKINYNENNLENVEKYYSSANYNIIKIFIFLSGIIFLTSFFIKTSISEILKFYSIIILLYCFSIVPEEFLKVRKDYKRLFLARTYAQISFIIGIILAYNRIFESIYYTYIIYYIIYNIRLYKKIPINIKPRKGTFNIKFKLPTTYYLFLIIIYLQFRDLFSYSFLFLEISFFIRNVFSFLINYYETFASTKEKEELVKLNFIRLHEYIYFFSLPYFIFFLIFAKEISNFLKIEQNIFPYYYILIIFIIGFLNIDFTNIILYSKNKIKAIKNLSILKTIVFLLFSINSFFGFSIYLIFFLIFNLIMKSINIILVKNLIDIELITKDYFYVFFAAGISSIIALILKEFLIINFVNFIIILLITKIFYLLIVYLLSKDMLKRIIRYVFSDEN